MGIVLKVGGTEFSKWESVSVELLLNSVTSTFDLTGWMDESNRHLFKPFGFTECEIILRDDDAIVNDETDRVLITGLLVNPGIATQKEPTLTRIIGMSKTGILEQCQMPPAIYPLQYNNVSLAYIARRICDYFNLELYIHPGAQNDAYKKYEEVVCQKTESVKSFLSKISHQRGITVAHDNLGRLMLYKIVNITEASSKITRDDLHVNMSISPNGQGMHSLITAYNDEYIDPENDNGDTRKVEIAGKYSTLSPFMKPITITKGKGVNQVVKQVHLNKTVQASNIPNNELGRYAKQIASEEARNFPIRVTKQGWTFENRIVRAGFYLNLENHDLFVDGEIKTVVESMTFTKSATDTEMLSFTCLLPCVYTGIKPSKSPFIDL